MTKGSGTKLRSVALAGAALSLGAAVFVCAAPEASAQKMTKVKYAEVVRSVFYLPKYVALAKGFFEEQGIEVDMTTAWGGDKGTAMLLTGKVDIVLQGPETAVYIENGASPLKTKMFSAITSTDGLFLSSRKKMTMEEFKWEMLKGKKVMGWRPGSTPGLFLEYAMKNHGIDPRKDIDHVTNIAIPARIGAFMSNDADYAVFFEPDVARLERQGIAYPVASVGKEVGPVDYTVFMATDKYIAEHPDIVQAWTDAIYKAQRWIQTANATEAAEAATKYFPKVELADIAAAVERYRKFGIWKSDPTTSQKAIEDLQTILIEGGVLKEGNRVSYESIVTTKFSEAAKKKMN